MNYAAREWAETKAKAKGAARYVLVLLAAHADGDGLVTRNVGLKYLEERTGDSARQIMRILQKLEALGDLLIERSKGRQNTYRVLYLAAATSDTFGSSDIIGTTTKSVTTTSDKSGTTTSDKSGTTTSDIFVGGNALKTLKATTNNKNKQPARAKESSSTSAAEPKTDDDDDFLACDLWLGDFAEKRYSAGDVRCAAQHMADEFGLYTDWAGFDGWVKRADPQKIAWLLGWLQFYGDKPIEAQFQIKSLTAVILAHLKNDERAHLRPAQMAELERTIATACELERFPAKLAQDLQARHGGAAWVPAEAAVEQEGGRFWM